MIFVVDLQSVNDSDLSAFIVSARELHAFLQIETPFDAWMPHRPVEDAEYTFDEGTDYITFPSPKGPAYMLTRAAAIHVINEERTDKAQQAYDFLQKSWDRMLAHNKLPVVVRGVSIIAPDCPGNRVVTFDMIDHVHKLGSGTAQAMFNDDPSAFNARDDYRRVYFGIEAVFGPRDPSVLPTLVLTESGYVKMAQLFASDPALVAEMVRLYFHGKAETYIFDPADAKQLFSHVPLQPVNEYEDGVLLEQQGTPLECRAQEAALKVVRALPVIAAADEPKASTSCKPSLRLADSVKMPANAAAPPRKSRTSSTGKAAKLQLVNPPRAPVEAPDLQPVDKPLHPGALIAAFIALVPDYSASLLAQDLDLSRSLVSLLVSGKRVVSADTAVRLENVTGIPARTWMEQQSAHDLHAARQSCGTRTGRVGKPPSIEQLRAHAAKG